MVDDPVKIGARSPDAVFAEGLRQGRLLLQRSKRSGRYVFPPRAIAPARDEGELEWCEASGGGVVYSTTTVRPAASEAYNISIIELMEGPRLMSRVVDIPPDEVRIGMAVQAKPGEADGRPVVLFLASAHG